MTEIFITIILVVVLIGLFLFSEYYKSKMFRKEKAEEFSQWLEGQQNIRKMQKYHNAMIAASECKQSSDWSRFRFYNEDGSSRPMTKNEIEDYLNQLWEDLKI